MKPLTKAEEQLMHILWSREKGFLKDILEEFREPRPHSNTVATLLRILVDKKYVDFSVVGRNNLYKPVVSHQEYGRKTANQLLKGYFEGSPAKLVSHFISDNKLSVAELDELLKQIQNAKNKSL